MGRNVICSQCGHKIPESIEQERARSEEITFFVDGVPVKSRAVREDTSFWKIVRGKYTGNLVHVFDVIK